ncbi:STAS domain-containing protein [Brevifollis gellanilyticus]|uniref:Polyvinylalcohol dehydrogenase n=1 Tax=Brevifollis gellanilyticus TaxID=748831 RepID=A0A512M677_9BACT|nr:STAS domain-containing protein [Brevifollis gellanilyticus]GEP42245.1 polyvinylalcohol dehydrogenase [Brevifollis gellanilyticus]
MSKTQLPGIIKKAKDKLQANWVQQQFDAVGMRRDLIKTDELTKQSGDFLNQFLAGVESGNMVDIKSPAWAPALEFLNTISRQRERMGFSPSETAQFVFSLKEPLFAQLRTDLKGSPDELIEEMNSATALLDKLGLYVTEVFQSAREDVIKRQQEEMLELSTPVVKMWDGIVALPLIGTLDSARTSVVMESLLQRIVETGSEIAIIDITGVPTVDTLVAQHLLKTVAAARLMGADCIISGIRPQIAQTMVHLAIDLSAVTTKASLAEALKVALQRTGHRVVRDVDVK